MLLLPIIDDPVRKALEADVSDASTLVSLATVLVAIGVVLEGVNLIDQGYAWLRKILRERRERVAMKELAEIFPVSNFTRLPEAHRHESGLVKACSRIGLILVVVGVVAEWRYGIRLENAHNAVHLYDLNEIEAAQEQAGDAAVSAKTAHDEAGAASIKARQADMAAGAALKTSKTANAAALEAQENVDEVTEQSDVLGRKLWQIEYWRSGRTLRDFWSLVATLRKFKGKEIVLTSFIEGEDPETYDLCNSFFLAASNAEMQAINRCGKEPPSAPPRSGVLVYGVDDKETEEFAKIFADSVTSGGAGGMPPIAGSPLTILVGKQSPFFMDSKEQSSPPPIRKKSKPIKKP